MKKAIINTRNITILFVAIISMGFAPEPLKTRGNGNPIEIKLLNKLNDKPLFQLNVNNAEAGEFRVKVKDGFENVLYLETLKGTNVWRRYLLDVNLSDFFDPEFRLVFEITNRKTNKSYFYSVTRDTRIVEDIMIAKL